ncbi:hypothetical protein [uncultured Methanobrevibacter sp.]|uniref:hypothetical protein n=1 Tax=uncultured Methanobrevibacter sp. TaxID=253161 RepID=UPI0025F1CFA8|nr:hypothetical protein [uncultured Methanobrevibacter sp.]
MEIKHVLQTDKVLPNGNYYPQNVIDKSIKEFRECLKNKSTKKTTKNLEDNNISVNFAVRGSGDLNNNEEVLNFDTFSIDIISYK